MLFPCTGSGTTPLDPNKVRMSDPLILSGLIYKNISLQMKRVDNNVKHLNNNASRIAQYLTNPYAIYSNVDIYGDVIVVASGDILPDMNTKDRIIMLTSMFDFIYKNKLSKTIPDDLLSWSENRVDLLNKSINDAKSNNTAYNLIEKRRDILINEVKSYGQHRKQ